MKKDKNIPSWEYFKRIILEEDEELELPPMDNFLFYSLRRFQNIRGAKKTARHSCLILKELMNRYDKNIYSGRHVQDIFIFIEQMAKYNGYSLEEMAKNDQIFNLLIQAMFSFDTCVDNPGMGGKSNEIRFLIRCFLEPEYVIQRFQAGMMDYRPEYVYAATLLEDVRLQSYLLKALRFYESVPQEELLYPKEVEIENIIEGIGQPGWEDFIPILEQYLYCSDESIPMTSADSLGIIGGKRAGRILKKFLWKSLEGFLPLEDFHQELLYVNIVLAEKGIRGLFRIVKNPHSPLLRVQIAIQTLTSFKEPRIIRFLHTLLRDERFSETLVPESDDTQEETSYPLREEAFMALESFDIGYVTRILGKNYLKQREQMLSRWENLYNHNGEENDME